jgi:hypothetical protein
MRTSPIRCVYDGEAYSMCTLTGSLLKRSKPALNINPDDRPPKVTKALEGVENPYSLLPPRTRNQHRISSSSYKLARRTYEIGKLNFWMLRRYAAAKSAQFESTTEAIAAFNVWSAQESLRDICLSKCFYAAKTSSSFEKSGVLFIGVQLPLYRMHAWIIESNSQADPEDMIWTDFHPLVAFY